jgi:hypothetical protein
MKNLMFNRVARPESGRGARAKGSLGRRSVELRASAAVGWRWQAVFSVQMVCHKSTRRGWGAGRQAQMVGDLTTTGGSSIPVLRPVEGVAMIFKAAAAG